MKSQAFILKTHQERRPRRLQEPILYSRHSDANENPGAREWRKETPVPGQAGPSQETLSSNSTSYDKAGRLEQSHEVQTRSSARVYTHFSSRKVLNSL